MLIQGSVLIGDNTDILSTFLFAFYTVCLKRPKQEQYLSKRGFDNINFNNLELLSLTVCTRRNFYYGLPKVETWKRDLVQ